MQIILQPVLFKPSKNIISILEKVLSEEFNASIGTASQIEEIPIQLFDKQRRQWKSMIFYNGFQTNTNQTN
jgi:hypothetical protein